MGFDEEWQADDERVDRLLKDATRYVSSLKAWKKACQTGNFNERQKASALAAQLAPALAEPVSQAASAFGMDAREYLSEAAWRRDVIAIAAVEPFGLRVSEEADTLVSSPVVVRALPGRGVLQIGRQSWPHLRPRAVAAELKRLRERTAGAGSADFLESLFAVWNRQRSDGLVFMRLRDIYELWALTPGWKRENPPAKFAQDVYGLHRSGTTVTRGGKKIDFVTPSGNAKTGEIYTVIAEDGRTLRYHGIRFSDPGAAREAAQPGE